MNKYNKGTTLVEIMVSVILISIVMIFIFTILVDLKSEYSLSTKRSTDSINRAALIRIIQNDFINLKLNGISDNCDDGKVCLYFYFQKDPNVRKLVVYDNYIVYDLDTNAKKERWELSGGNYNADQVKICYYENGNPGKENHYLRINIPASFNTSSNRKYDIELTNYDVGKITFYGQVITNACS